MRLAVSSDNAEGLARVPAGRRWFLYSFTPESQAELVRVRDQFKRVQEQQKGKGGGSVSIGIAQEGVAARDPALAETRWESWLRTSIKDGSSLVGERRGTVEPGEERVGLPPAFTTNNNIPHENANPGSWPWRPARRRLCRRDLLSFVEGRGRRACLVAEGGPSDPDSQGRWHRLSARVPALHAGHHLRVPVGSHQHQEAQRHGAQRDLPRPAAGFLEPGPGADRSGDPYDPRDRARAR
jgi:hypothetical protein